MERIFRRTIKAKKQEWVVEAWIGKSGRAHCTIYKVRINPYGGFRVLDSVRPEELIYVPAAVLKANVEGMKKVEKANAH